MKIAVLFGPLCLSFRGSFDFDNIRTDARGLTGSELGFVRIAEELKKAGHSVTLFTKAEQTEWNGMPIRSWDEAGGEQFELSLAINEPDLLRNCTGLRVVAFWLNDVSFCRAGFENYVDLWCSPSPPHLEQILTNPKWRLVEVTPDHPQGKVQYTPDPAKWIVVPLGCDPERYPTNIEKISGRVVYCSSPDRGLHWLLQEWPMIKRAVPHATLRIFYRLQPWIDGFKGVKYFPPIERLRARALYIEETLRRLKAPEWGIELCDSVSRERIELEMAQAEVMAYPLDTTSWSEGFSCTILEGCAARACPIIMDCDAPGEIYKDACIIARRGAVSEWREHVIAALKGPHIRKTYNELGALFAERHTWKLTTERILSAARERMKVSDAA